MSQGGSIALGSEATAQPALVAPANIVPGPNGGVVVDTKIPATPAKPAEQKKPTYDELEKNYNELRTKMSQDGAPNKDAKPADAKPADAAPVAPTGEVAAKAVADAGLDMATLEAEYAEKKTLSEESLVKLEKAGLSRAQVDAYIKGQEARGTLLRTEFAALAGGENRLTAVYEWAGANMDAKDLASYNGLIDAGNTEGAKLMLKGIVASYEAVNGREPALVTGDNSRSGGGTFQPYESNAQMVKDMASVEYQTDPAFRAKVSARLAVTTKFLR